MKEKKTMFGLAAMRLGSVFVAAALLSGCVGLDTVLFTTKTQVGIDGDLMPATLDFGYARTELVVQPAFERGKTFPVLSSAEVEGGLLTFGSKQSFATGDAAIVMSKKLTDSGDYDLNNDATRIKNSDYLDEGEIRTLPFVSGDKPKLFPKRRPLFFGTKTNFGLHVEFTAENAPTAVHVGYRRKELAIAPLIERTARLRNSAGDGSESGNPLADTSNGVATPLIDIKLVSLLATVGASSKVGKPADTSANISQMFATGVAATNLAQHQEVRQVLGSSLVPNFQQIQQQARARVSTFKVDVKKQRTSYATIMKEFNDKKTDLKKENIFNVAVDLKIIDGVKVFKYKTAQKIKEFGKLLSDYVDGNKPERLKQFKELEFFAKSLDDN